MAPKDLNSIYFLKSYTMFLFNNLSQSAGNFLRNQCRFVSYVWLKCSSCHWIQAPFRITAIVWPSSDWRGTARNSILIPHLLSIGCNCFPCSHHSNYMFPIILQTIEQKPTISPTKQIRSLHNSKLNVFHKRSKIVTW